MRYLFPQWRGGARELKIFLVLLLQLYLDAPDRFYEHNYVFTNITVNFEPVLANFRISDCIKKYNFARKVQNLKFTTNFQ